MLTAEEKDHAEYSCSGSERWLNCPASHTLSKKAPPQLESPWAKEGTEAHACLEFILKNRSKPLRAVAKMALKTWNKDMVGHACDAADWLVARQVELPGSELVSERKVDTSPFLCADQFGTLDAAIIEPFGKLVIADYKYGVGVVDPEGTDGKGNSQLVCYALAVSFAYDHNFESVDLVVIQPRAFHSSGNNIRVHTLTIDQLLAWVPRLRNAVMETNNPKAEYKAGAWCKFCPAKAICPEISVNALKSAKAVFGATPAEPLKLAAPKELGDLPQMLKACDALEDWIGAVREFAFLQLSQGRKVPGYKLVAKRAQRKWTNAEVVSAKARKAFGTAAFSAPELLSPAQLEKLHAKAKDFVKKHTTAESSGTTLVPESDKREAVKTLKEIFGALPAPVTKEKNGARKVSNR